MHVEAGHNSSEPEDIPKDLRCPLCLYHTKNKSNMIDHVVLHRGKLEGRAPVMPAVARCACGAFRPPGHEQTGCSGPRRIFCISWITSRLISLDFPEKRASC